VLNPAAAVAVAQDSEGAEIWQPREKANAPRDVCVGSLGCAPGIVKFVGGEVAEAIEATRLMYEITLADNPAYRVLVLGFRATSTGVDASLVIRTGILPHINTGMAGKVAGTGPVGAGLVNPPVAIFMEAVAALGQLAPPLRFDGDQPLIRVGPPLGQHGESVRRRLVEVDPG
jgi:hypothetical protein